MLKPLSFIAFVLCAIGVSLYIFEQDPGKISKGRSGQMVLQDLDTKSLNRINIESSAGLLELHHSKGGNWTVKHLDYPISKEKIQELLLELTEMRLGDLVSVNPERHGLFKLLDPPLSEKDWDESRHAISLNLLLGDESSLLDFRIGKVREQGNGQYARFAGDNEVYLLPEALQIDTDTNEWLDKNLLLIKKEDFRNLKLHHSDEKPFNLVYDNETSKWELQGTEETLLKEKEIENLTDRLQDLEFTGLLEGTPSDNDTGRTRLTSLEVLLTDGKIYSLKIGENENEEGNHVLSLRMSIQVETDSLESRKEMESFNKRVGGRLFEIRSWEARDLLKKKTEFLKEG